ncbi:MAG: hypothetical protein JWP91_1039 [Fibrobacteres bacterium]|nr:hypothetical protein [Fibrobacterota bacterium]
MTSSKSIFVTAYKDAAAQNRDGTGNPPSEEDGKFVILAKGKGVHLVLSPISLTPYHANIVYQYLQVEGRGDVEAVSSSGCRIITKGWSVHGGGYFTLQHWLHNLTLHGKSTAFGKYEKSLLAAFEDQIGEKLGLAGYTLEFK